MKMRQHHLPDDRLIALSLAGAPLPVEHEHLESCPLCAERCARLTTMLADVSDVTAAEADALFTSDRLAKQRARILQRIEQDGRPGRVISFPAGPTHRPPLRERPGMRWIAGAAAAGLLIGVLADHLAHQFPGRAAGAPAQAAARPGADPSLQAVSTTISEEEFLGQLETAIEATGGSALRPLDDMTPRVWEVAGP